MANVIVGRIEMPAMIFMPRDTGNVTLSCRKWAWKHFPAWAHDFYTMMARISISKKLHTGKGGFILWAMTTITGLFSAESCSLPIWPVKQTPALWGPWTGDHMIRCEKDSKKQLRWPKAEHRSTLSTESQETVISQQMKWGTGLYLTSTHLFLLIMPNHTLQLHQSEE